MTSTCRKRTSARPLQPLVLAIEHGLDAAIVALDKGNPLLAFEGEKGRRRLGVQLVAQPIGGLLPKEAIALSCDHGTVIRIVGRLISALIP